MQSSSRTVICVTEMRTDPLDGQREIRRVREERERESREEKEKFDDEVTTEGCEGGNRGCD